MKAYPKYKDSGVPWLERVPEHWKIISLGALMVERKELNKNRNIDFVLSVTKDRGVIPYAEKGNIGNKASEDTSRYKVVRKDDIVLNSMNVIIGSVGISNYIGCLSPVYYVLKSRDTNLYDSKYLNFYFQTKPFQRSLVRIGNGILAHRMRIPMEKLKRESFPLPSFPEQQQISRYLDWQNSRIDKIIKAKKKLIALQKEQKQNIINKAVTKGINPDVKMKDSGVEWLGEIPEHWEVRRLKTIGEVKASGVDKQSKNDETPVKLCNYVDVYKNYNITGSLDFMGATATHEERSTFELKANDVIITKDSETWDDIAVPAFVPESLSNVICAYHLSLIRPQNEYIKGNFLCYAFFASTIAYQFKVTATGVTRFGLSQGAIKDSLFSVPPIEEQKEIVAHIEKEITSVDKTIARTEREIELIQEYRTRLVSDVVTGKVDVRAVEIPDFEPVEADLEAQDDEESEDELIAEGIEE